MSNILDWFFPKLCFSCQKTGGHLCNDCRKSLPELAFQLCPICEKAALNGLTHYRCLKKRGLDGLISLFPYQQTIKELLRQFKYKRATELGDLLVDLVVNRLEKKDILSFWREEKFVFLPVPLFPARKLWRGFNQSELLLERFCTKLQLSFDNETVFRRRWTGDQAKLSLKKREENIANAFRFVDKSKILGRSFVIFDDVWTTGATIKECCQVLKNAEAEKVWGLTLCR